VIKWLAGVLFRLFLVISIKLPQSRFSRWFFFGVVTRFYDFHWRIYKKRKAMIIKTIKELATLYENGSLKKSDGDVILFDKRCTLQTEKDYEFELSYDDIAWQALTDLGIYISGV
jgi:hypothetical protein